MGSWSLSVQYRHLSSKTPSMLGILALLCGLFYLLAAFLIVTYCVRDRGEDIDPRFLGLGGGGPMISMAISKDSCARDSLTTHSIPSLS